MAYARHDCHMIVFVIDIDGVLDSLSLFTLFTIIVIAGCFGY